MRFFSRSKLPFLWYFGKNVEPYPKSSFLWYFGGNVEPYPKSSFLWYFGKNMEPYPTTPPRIFDSVKMKKIRLSLLHSYTICESLIYFFIFFVKMNLLWIYTEKKIVVKFFCDVHQVISICSKSNVFDHTRPFKKKNTLHIWYVLVENYQILLSKFYFTSEDINNKKNFLLSCNFEVPKR